MTEQERESHKKWRNNNRDKYNASKKKNYDRSMKYAHNNHIRWTKEEDALVLKHDIPDIKLAEQLKKSVQAIQVRRSKVNYPDLRLMP